MHIRFVSTSVSTDRLLKLATKYCAMYKELPKHEHKEVYFRIADFLRFLETNLNDEISNRQKEMKRQIRKKQSPKGGE